MLQLVPDYAHSEATNGNLNRRSIGLRGPSHNAADRTRRGIAQNVSTLSLNEIRLLVVVGKDASCQVPPKLRIGAMIGSIKGVRSMWIMVGRICLNLRFNLPTASFAVSR